MLMQYSPGCQLHNAYPGEQLMSTFLFLVLCSALCTGFQRLLMHSILPLIAAADIYITPAVGTRAAETAASAASEIDPTAKTIATEDSSISTTSGWYCPTVEVAPGTSPPATVHRLLVQPTQ